MRQDAMESSQRVVQSGVDDGDSQRILDLIEQLDRDLIETKKKASKRG